MSGNQQAGPAQRQIFVLPPDRDPGFRMQHGFEHRDEPVRELVRSVSCAAGPAA